MFSLYLLVLIAIAVINLSGTTQDQQQQGPPVLATSGNLTKVQTPHLHSPSNAYKLLHVMQLPCMVHAPVGTSSPACQHCSERTPTPAA